MTDFSTYKPDNSLYENQLYEVRQLRIKWTKRVWWALVVISAAFAVWAAMIAERSN